MQLTKEKLCPVGTVAVFEGRVPPDLEIQWSNM